MSTVIAIAIQTPYNEHNAIYIPSIHSILPYDTPMTERIEYKELSSEDIDQYNEISTKLPKVWNNLCSTQLEVETRHVTYIDFPADEFDNIEQYRATKSDNLKNEYRFVIGNNTYIDLRKCHLDEELDRVTNQEILIENSIFYPMIKKCLLTMFRILNTSNVYERNKGACQSHTCHVRWFCPKVSTKFIWDSLYICNLYKKLLPYCLYIIVNMYGVDNASMLLNPKRIIKYEI